MDVGDLVKKFMDADMQLTEGALQILREKADSELVASHVLETLGRLNKRPPMVTADIVAKILESGMNVPIDAISIPEPKPEIEPEEKLPELTHTKFRPVAAEYEPRVNVLKEITGKSYCKGELNDFVKLFNSRFEKLRPLLAKRTELGSAVSVSSLSRLQDRETVAVIGLVAEKNRYSTGNLGIELEDPTGRTLAFVFQNDKKLLKKADDVVVDEVIGVVGTVRVGGRYPRIFVKDIIWPDMPVKRERRVADNPLSAVLISDLHVGSDQFLEDVFRKFVKWLREGGETRRDNEIVSKVKYLVIAGDVVDGIGVYPEQEDELLISDVFKQYDAAAKILSEIPDHIKLVIAPGNHDAVRPAEPQPAISKDVGNALYDLNSVMVGNPAVVSLEGVRFLVYHGRSFDDLIAAVPGLTRDEPAEPMVKLLQKRHLAPIYGGRVSVSPEEQDSMVIEEIPDVFHCGHVHRYGCTKYRDIWVVNSATFQARTKYMQKLGVKPTPGHVAVLNLQNHTLEEKIFA